MSLNGCFHQWDTVNKRHCHWMHRNIVLYQSESFGILNFNVFLHVIPKALRSSQRVPTFNLKIKSQFEAYILATASTNDIYWCGNGEEATLGAGFFFVVEEMRLLLVQLCTAPIVSYRTENPTAILCGCLLPNTLHRSNYSFQHPKLNQQNHAAVIYFVLMI